MVSIRTAYSPRERVQVSSDKPSLTVQSSKDECDINNILKKYVKTQLMDHVNVHQGSYGDYTSVQDYHTSVQQVMAAEEMFMSLPSGLRKRFGNDPAEFLAFVEDEANVDEARKLGLIPGDVNRVEAPEGAGEAQKEPFVEAK